MGLGKSGKSNDPGSFLAVYALASPQRATKQNGKTKASFRRTKALTATHRQCVTMAGY